MHARLSCRVNETAKPLCRVYAPRTKPSRHRLGVVRVNERGEGESHPPSTTTVYNAMLLSNFVPRHLSRTLSLSFFACVKFVLHVHTYTYIPFLHGFELVFLRVVGKFASVFMHPVHDLKILVPWISPWILFRFENSYRKEY